MPTLETDDGTRIFYRARGRGRPPFLFVHGWCSNGKHWNAQLRHFARRHRVLAVDRRGHGRSAAPAGGYTAERHAADLAAVARAEGIRGAVVVGHAGGGPATLAFARAYPELARALVLVDSRIGPAARLGDPEDPAGAALGALVGRLEGENGAAELRAMYTGFFSPWAGPAGRRALREALATPLRVAAAELRSLAADTQEIARAIAQPVLWLSVGAADQPALAALFRNVQFGQLVGSGHFPHLEVPAQVNAMVERFVATLPPRRPHGRAAPARGTRRR